MKIGQQEQEQALRRGDEAEDDDEDPSPNQSSKISQIRCRRSECLHIDAGEYCIAARART